MLEGIEPELEPVSERVLPEWRSVVSAWVFVLLLVMLFAGTQALASRHHAVRSPATLAGATIPRHDPASVGVGVPCAAPLEQCGRVATAVVPEMPYPYTIW